MLTPSQIADIAVARLGLPVPMAKLQIMHSLAASLHKEESSSFVWDALLRWLKSRELESEVLEGLCALVLAKGARSLEISALRSSITRPSILSDFLIAQCFDVPLIVSAWIHSHSEELPPLVRLNEEIEELNSARFIPPIFGNRLRSLEKRFDMPLLQQWAYEYKLLLARVTYTNDGHFGYFRGGTMDGAGMFVGKRSHLARSAFLRTLALAVARWDMPQKLAEETARLALPAEPILLKLLPSSPPSWAMAVHAWPIDQSKPNSNVVAEIVEYIESQTERTLLHFNGCIQSTKTVCIEAQVTTVLIAAGTANPNEVFEIQNALLGKIQIPRQGFEFFKLDGLPHDYTFPSEDGTDYVPALFPLIGISVGYLSTDLIHLLPQLPVFQSTESSITASPEVGGVLIATDGKLIGKVDYWNWRWQPMHERDTLPPSAVCTTLSSDAIKKLMLVSEYHLERCWRITLRTRKTDYGSWTETVHLGSLNSTTSSQ